MKNLILSLILILFTAGNISGQGYYPVQKQSIVRYKNTDNNYYYSPAAFADIGRKDELTPQN